MRTGAGILCGVLIVLAAAWSPLHAQPIYEESRPAFSLSSSEIVTTRETPFFYLTFQRLTRLDFRVYKVRDAVKFFSGLSDPHRLGSEDVPAPVEQSAIERLTSWKRSQRSRIRTFVRDQVSYTYRASRRASSDKTEVAQRVTLNRSTFAQVPLLNPGQLVTSWREQLPNLRDPELRRIPLDVKEPGVYVVEAVAESLRAYTVVVISDVGLVTKTSPGQMFVFAANRLTGEPREGCDVRILTPGQPISGATDADGVLTTPLPATEADSLVTLAQCGDELGVTDPQGWSLRGQARELLGYIYTDKPIYRPGHTVHVKAVLRWRAQDMLASFDQASVELSASDVDNKVIFRRAIPVDEFGAVNASIPLPATVALGPYALRVTSGENQAVGSFEVQEYRRPEFEVIVTPASRFVVQGQEAVASVQAKYYFGQPVANARVRYVINRQPYYSSLRYSDEEDEGGDGGYYYDGEQTSNGELRLDAQGRGEIRVPTTVAERPGDYSLRIEAQVADASGREVSGNTIVHATYGSFLLTAQVNGYVFRPGQQVTVSVRAVDYTGGVRGGLPVAVVVEQRKYAQGYYRDPTITRLSQSMLTLNAQGRGDVPVTLGNGPGSYVIRVTTTENGRSIGDEASAWVPGEDFGSELEGDRYLELIADKKTYAVGDTARVLVRGEQVTGPVLLTKEGQQVTWHRVVTVAAGDAFEVPIDAGDVGDVYVNVAYMREGRLYRAERRLSVPADSRTLTVSLAADNAVAKPQQPGVFTVNVRDAAGAPVQASVSLGVIDEAVYAIGPDRTADPVRFFYRREYSRVNTIFSRNYYFVGYSGSERLQLARRGRRPFSLADFKGDKEAQPQVRKEFPDAIYWIGDIVTDSNGNARVALKYPDALTTWRLTARAVTRDTLVGVGIARTTTTKDLIVRPITPRFLTEGDQLVLPTIVHNYLDEAKDTTVSFEAMGLQPAQGSALAPVTSAIAPRGERRDDWRFVAPTVGTVTVTATARTDSDTDAVELPIPVLPFGLRRELGSSGALATAGEATANIEIPAMSNASGRTIHVSLAPSMAGSMLGALDFLTSYPYGCTEQTLSSFLPNLVVMRALAQLKIAPAERLTVVDRQVGSGLKRLLDYQHDDGGWGWWKTDENHPFMTAYAMYGLGEARREGFTVDAERFERGVRALAAMHAEYPRAEPDLKAYMVYVLGRVAGERASIAFNSTTDGGRQQRQYSKADALNAAWEARARMSSYGRALLLLALDDAKDARGAPLAGTLMGEVQTVGELSYWKSTRDDLLFDATIDTSVEATATAIAALVRRDPRNPVLDRAVRWLMLNRSGGYWISTKQTAVALYGLLEVLKVRDETPQTFTADIFVNGQPAGSQTFTPASITDPDPVIVSAAGREGANSVRIVKRGGGTLYWSATGVYFDPRAAEARTGSRQLALARRYARLTPVQRNGTIRYREEPIAGDIRPGDVLTVRLTAAGSTDWKYLLLEDPLPAGVEAIQDTTAYPLETGRAEDWWWYGPRVEYRDSKTLFFQREFDQGRYEYVYLVKVVSAGTFAAVPAQITPMYVPRVAASSEPFSLTVVVPQETPR